MKAKKFVEEIKNRFTDCDDFAVREMIKSSGDKIYILYIINLCDKKYVTEGILKSICEHLDRIGSESIPQILSTLPLSTCSNVDTATEMLLAGNAVICSDTENSFFAYAADAKNESGRAVMEPKSEIVIRGPRQGFVESAEANVTMIRKIIKSSDLKVINLVCGDKTSTNIKIMYYEGIARKDIITEVIRRIENVKMDSCIDSGYLEQCLQKRKYRLFSELGNSEKPDKVAAKILGGRVAIICDGSPVVLTAPYLFVESIQSSEDYLKNVYYANFVRVLRFLGMIISLYLPAVYVSALSFHKGAVPYLIYMAQMRARSNIPFDVFSELLIILIIFELIREVGLRMPRSVGDAVGIVGGLILGDAAIKAGFASETVIMIAALSAICNFMNPTYMNINVPLRFANLLLARVFGFLGIAVGVMLLLTLVCSEKSFGVPFMSPFAPFKNNLFRDGLTMDPALALSMENEELKRNGGK